MVLAFHRVYRVQIVCADISSVLSELALFGIELRQVEAIDYVTAYVSMDGRALKIAKNLLEHMGVSHKIVKQQGNIWEKDLLYKRMIFVVGMVLFLLAGVTIPNRILFVEVTGNNDISTHRILTEAEDIGIKFYARTKDIRSEECKNKLLERIPQLQWVGITIKGCVAIIQVEERSMNPIDEETHIISNLVSVCDGVITDQTIYRGNPLFRVGDAVKKGDVLVSGYVDCGLKLSASQAKAEIYALTMREYQFISLKPSALRGEIQKVHTCYQLRIGKKVINFCNHSGIIDATCAKMYVEDYWTFPGGYQLPAALIKISYWNHEMLPASSSDVDNQWFSRFAREYLGDHLVSGKILDERLQQQETEDLFLLSGTYACHEMIGKEKYEEIIE